MDPGGLILPKLLRGAFADGITDPILLMYGYLLLFAWVLVEQLGIPLPATPVLLAAGALSADGPIRFPLAFWPRWLPR